MGSCSTNRRPENARFIDLRYGKTPYCKCPSKCEIKVVESQEKASKGHLYYCCPNKNSQCKFFRWCTPIKATLGSQGCPVEIDAGNEACSHSTVKEKTECGEVADVVSRVSTISGSSRNEVNGNFIHISWVFSAVFFTMMVMFWLKL